MEFELADGAVFTVRALSADPGFGFITICPHPDAEGEDEDVVLPVGSIRRITLGRPEPERQRFGFSAA